MENGIIIGQIFKSLWEAIKELDPTEQAEMYNAIFQYQFTGELPNFKNKYLSIMFKSHLPTIDKMINNQKVKIENGKKGGAPKGNCNAKKTTTENNQIKKTETENKQKQPKTTENNQKQANSLINKKQEIKNKKQEIINNNQEIKKEIAVIKANRTPQQEIYDYFSAKYKQLTGIDYKSDSKDFILIAKLLKTYEFDIIKQKIDWLEVGCKKSIFWFAKNINDFTIATLSAQWNRIFPQLTEEQKKQLEKKRQEEEVKKRIIAGLEAEKQLRRQTNASRLQ